MSTATEIDTDVAENTTPMNAAGIGLKPNSRLTPPITATGNTTPMHAMMMAAFEYFFSNCRSQPTPPRNMRMMMPRSLNSDSESLICSTFSNAGPHMMPTRICPMTSGSCSFRHASPETVVSIKMAHSEMMNVAMFFSFIRIGFRRCLLFRAQQYGQDGSAGRRTYACRCMAVSRECNRAANHIIGHPKTASLYFSHITGNRFSS